MFAATPMPAAHLLVVQRELQFFRHQAVLRTLTVTVSIVLPCSRRLAVHASFTGVPKCKPYRGMAIDGLV